MISLVLFILIGLKLEMMNGLYLALIIIDIVLWMINLILKSAKFALELKKVGEDE